IRVLLLTGVVAAFAEASFSQTFVGIDFEQLASPSGCIRNAPANIPNLPALKLPGLTISGGQVLSFQNPFQFSPNNVYSTSNACAGEQPTMTITFDGPVSNVNLVVGQFVTGSETLQVTDDQGGNQTIQLLSSNVAGQSLFFPTSN